MFLGSTCFSAAAFSAALRQRSSRSGLLGSGLLGSGLLGSGLLGSGLLGSSLLGSGIASQATCVEPSGVARRVFAQIGHGFPQTLHHHVEHVLQSRAMGILTENVQESGDVIALGDLLDRFDPDQLLQGRIASQLSQTGFEVAMPQGDGQDDHSPQHGHGIIIATVATPRTQALQQRSVGDGLEQSAKGDQARDDLPSSPRRRVASGWRFSCVTSVCGNGR